MNQLSAGARAAVRRLDDLVGGPARRHVVVVFAGVLALDSADKATVGTSATQLQTSLGIGKPQIGLLLTVSSLVGAAATIPFGILVDRMKRTRLLAAGIALWTVATIASGLATSFMFLLCARAGLGAVTAVAGPAVASLIGDYFPGADRGRMYGYVLAGELVGAGFGFGISGEFASLSWRAAFFALVPPSLIAAWFVYRLPEPARGGSSPLLPGVQSVDDLPEEPVDADGADPGGEPVGEPGGEPAGEQRTSAQDGDVHRAVADSGVKPRAGAVLDRPPDQLSIQAAVRYVLRIRTNVVLIVASALGYFFFSGLRGFAVEFSKKQYGVTQHEASLLVLVVGSGAVVGVLSGGRLADRLLRRGRLAARPEVSGTAVLLAACVFVPALMTRTVAVALPLLIIAAFFLGATNPPLDAARLDIIHPVVWGRADAVRTVLRTGGDAAAPVTFGVLSGTVFTGRSGLQYTFLIMLGALAAAALITLLIGRRTYPSDVAAARVSLRRFPGSP